MIDPNANRLAWLHSSASNDVDGYEWGIFRVKWKNGQPAEVWQTASDFSDLDAARGAAQVTQAAVGATSRTMQSSDPAFTVAMFNASEAPAGTEVSISQPPIAAPAGDDRSRASGDVVADTRRLDHLQKTGSTVDLVQFARGGASWKFRIGGLHHAAHEDIRAAIDMSITLGGTTTSEGASRGQRD